MSEPLVELKGLSDLFAAFLGHSVRVHTFSGRRNVTGLLAAFDPATLVLHLEQAVEEDCSDINELIIFQARDVKFIEFLDNQSVPVVTLLDRLAKKRRYAKKRYATYYKGKLD